MKIKKYPVLLLTFVFLATSGCAVGNDAVANTESSQTTSSIYAYDMELTQDVQDEVAESYSDDTGVVNTSPVHAMEKIIYTATAEVQTLQFDESVTQIAQLVERLGGYIESSSVTGQDYYALSKNRPSYRDAYYTLRIPTDQFSVAKSALSAIGNVTYINTDTQNVTTTYYDIQNRLNTYRTEEERLFNMLEKCETVEDMLAIESQLSNVRYEIESLTTSLNHYDHRIAYSTLNLSLYEVAELTNEKPITRTYWQQIGDGFLNSLQAVGKFFRNLFKGFLIATPYLAVLAVFAAAVFPVFRKLIRKWKLRKINSCDTPSEDK